VRWGERSSYGVRGGGWATAHGGRSNGRVIIIEVEKGGLDHGQEGHRRKSGLSCKVGNATGLTERL